MSTISTTSQLSNYVSCLGNNDAVITGTNYDLDVSFNTANTAVSLLSAQIVISKVFPMTPVATGNGFTISGWFLPYGKTQKSNALLIEMDTSVNPTAVYLTGGNSFSLNAVYNGVVVTTNSDISAGMVLPQTWNYFCYTVECSGNTVGTAQAIQSLYLNGSSIPVVKTTALYVSTPFTVTYMGKGIVYTNQFQGKLAEMRSFQRVLNPMENSILSACNNVGSPGAVTIIPSVMVADVSSTALTVAPYTVTNIIAFSAASAFNYVTISSTPPFVSGPSTIVVLSSMMQRVNGKLVWKDVDVNGSYLYSYSITPYMNGVNSSPITTYVYSNTIAGYSYINLSVMPLSDTGTTGVNTKTLTSASTAIYGVTGKFAFMNGTYNASSSSKGADTVPYTMFNSDINDRNTFWITNYGGNSYGQDPYLNYVYRGGINPTVYVTTVVSGETIPGEWLQLQFPYAFMLTGHGWLSRVYNGTLWIGKNYTIAGSNDGTTWTKVLQIITDTVSTTNGNGTYIETIKAKNAYSYYRLICTSGCDGGNWFGKKWYLYGSF